MSRDDHLYDHVETTIGGYKRIRTKRGTVVTFFDAERQAKRGLTTLWRSLTRMSRLARPPDPGDEYDFDWEHIDWLLDEVESMVTMWREKVREHGVQRSREDRIRQLRDVSGRTPDEAAA